MKMYRILSVFFMLIFVCSLSIGQDITDINRGKKIKKPKIEKPKPKTEKRSQTVNNTKKKHKRTTTKETIFSISSNSAQFGSNGGRKTFYIDSNKSWEISALPAHWGHLSRSNNELTLTVDANSSATDRVDYFLLKSGNKTLRVDVRQSGETIFSISSNKVNFERNGGVKTFSVSSNTSWQIKTNPASWGHLSREGNILTLKVDPNSLSSNRTDYFVLSSGNKTIRVDISQSGETTLSLSTQKLNFGSTGGSQTITVTTNGVWEIALSTASWGHLERNGNQLSVKIDVNNSSLSRSDYFKIKAGDKTLQVNISQDGRNSYTSTYPSRRYRRPFNSSCDSYWGGFSVGYIQKQWTIDADGYKEKMGMFDDDKYLQGIQAGIRIDPQFGYGFGMNSGLFYEYCWAKSKNQYDDYGKYRYSYNEHGLYAPLDFKYSMNFSEWFQLSLYAGVGFNYVISGKIKTKDDYGERSRDYYSQDDKTRFNMMFEYGAAIRIKAIQIDFSMSQGLNDWSDDSDYKIKQGRPMMISATWCF